MKKILLPLLLSTLACAAQAATITVTDVTDGSAVSGKCTLRDAVESVNNNSAMVGCISFGSDAIDTIEFDSSLAGKTIGVQSAAGGEIKIMKNLSINATAGGITLDANPGQSTPGGNRIFQVTGGDSLKITGVKFRNGKADNNGGAIFVNQTFPNSHTLTLEGCAFEGNLADDNGGAVYASTATIRNSSFTSNEANYGGAVHASTTVAISNSSFTSNEAISNGGAVSTWGTAGISNSTFSGNETRGGGGAVYSTTTTISNSAFTSNKAGNGGAVFDWDTADISDSTFSGNEASGGGGAVYANETATIRNSTFSSNEADNHGGAVSANTAAIISNSTFSGNQAISSDGGAVWTNAAIISNSTFNNNRADIEGGAVFAYNSLDARHLTLLNNSATGTGQAALYVYDFSGTAALHNSIIIGSNSDAQCAGTTFTGSYNLEGYESSGNWQVAASLTCGPSNPVPVSGNPPLNTIIATTLADNGGPTQTLALAAGSPAIGVADPGGTSQMWDFNNDVWTDATLDQRGSARKAAASGRDVGAYERNGLTITGNMPNGMVNVSYAGGSVIASGGTGTITYAVTSGVLPPELSLQPDGTVTGTPTQAGTWSFAITARDASGNLTGMGFEVTIHPFSTGTGNTPIPALPAPLLLMLAALVGAAAATRQRRR